MARIPSLPRESHREIASHLDLDLNLDLDVVASDVDVDVDLDVVASDVDAKVCILPPCLGILTPFHT